MNSAETLYQAFASSLDVDLSEINDDLAYNSFPKWDSTAHMILVAEIEAQFSIMLDTDDIIDMSSVAKAKEILSKYEVSF